MAATPRSSRPVALVTGASSGIGAALARCAAAAGHDLILVARRAAALEALAAELRAAGVAARVIVADLTTPEGVAQVKAALDAQGIDVLVNCAGIGWRGALATMPEVEIDATIALNVSGATRLLRAVLPGMVAQGRGRILNVASTAAFQPGPGMAVYFATKAYMLSLSEALSVELHGRNVTVTTLCPGPVSTELADRAGLRGTRLFSRMVGVAEASDVARAGWSALQAGRRLVVPGWRNRLFVALARAMPRALVMRSAREMLRARR